MKSSRCSVELKHITNVYLCQASNALNFRSNILYSMSHLTGNQWRYFKRGITWALFFFVITARAALFYAVCLVAHPASLKELHLHNRCKKVQNCTLILLRQRLLNTPNLTSVKQMAIRSLCYPVCKLIHA